MGKLTKNKIYLMKKAVSLVEMIIAIALMGAIVLGAIAFDLASRNLFNSSEEETVLLNELALVLDHLERNIKHAEGDVSNIGLSWNNPASELSIVRVSDAILNGTTQMSDANIGDYTSADYVTVVYGFSGGDITYEYDIDDSNSFVKILTPHLDTSVTLTVTVPPEGGVRINGLVLTDGAYTVSLADAGRVADPNNPGDAGDVVDPTIFFYPLSHSWN